jgi:hypothetical protein
MNCEEDNRDREVILGSNLRLRGLKKKIGEMW